jgi:hypothetical protein
MFYPEFPIEGYRQSKMPAEARGIEEKRIFLRKYACFPAAEF